MRCDDISISISMQGRGVGEDVNCRKNPADGG